MPNRLATAEATAHLQALANPQRLLTVLCLARGECTVSQLLQCTHANPSVLSQQLRVLRNRGVVSRTRRGQDVVYRLEDPTAADIARVACRSAASHA